MVDLQIDTGAVRLSISVDGQNGREIKFNPHDLIFVEKIHRLYFDLKAKHTEYQNIKALETSDEMPEDISGVIGPIRELNLWFRGQIDSLLGEGTAQAIFGDVLFADEKLGVYFQLLDAVISYTAPVRAEKIEKYLPPKKTRKRK
jgi:hypothetical protein